MTFTTPPANQGQAVTVGYADHNGKVYRRTRDGFGDTYYAVSTCLVDDQGDYWQAAPRNKRWRQFTIAQFSTIAYRASLEEAG